MPPKTSEEVRQDMENSKQLRISDKQRVLHASYAQELNLLKTRLDRVLAETTATLTTSRNERIERLVGLVERKAELEGRIWRVICEIRDCHVLAGRQLRAVVEGRKGDLEEHIARIEGVDWDGSGLVSGGGGEEGMGGGGDEDGGNGSVM